MNSINITFKNDGNYDESCLNVPITKDGFTIGIITSVTPKIVYGKIWDNKTCIEMTGDDDKIVSMEIYKKPQ